MAKHKPISKIKKRKSKLDIALSEAKNRIQNYQVVAYEILIWKKTTLLIEKPNTCLSALRGVARKNGG